MQTNTYTLYVRTGSDEAAGTDSNVFVQLIGTLGATESIHLPARDVFAFETNGVDKFVLSVPDVGELTRCCIGHDNSAGGSGWFVVDVRIQDDLTDREWVFHFDQWIGPQESGALFACVDL